MRPEADGLPGCRSGENLLCFCNPPAFADNSQCRLGRPSNEELMTDKYSRVALCAVVWFALGASPRAAMAGANPFLGEVETFAFNFCPIGWATLNGQLMPINQNQALFALLGTTYGGDGRVNFGLPNLQGNVPIHMGSGHTLRE